MNALIDLNLNDVALLVRVVQASSFSQAARERGVPVSTVSRRIARLETQLGARLLERTTRKLRLTDTGRMYFDHAERALDELMQGAHHVQELQLAPQGRIRMTAPVAMGGVVATSAALYLRTHPQVTLELDLSDRRVDMLAEGFDVALRAGRLPSSDLIARKLWDSTDYLFANPEYLKGRGALRRPDDLLAHDCIAMRGTEAGATWELFRGARSRRITFKPRALINELAAAKRATIAGLGVAMLPGRACEHEVTAGLLKQVLPEYRGGQGGLWLLYPPRRGLTAAVRTFIDHLLAELPGRQA